MNVPIRHVFQNRQVTPEDKKLQFVKYFPGVGGGTLKFFKVIVVN